MTLIRKLLLQHGYAFMFCYVLGVQLGVPLPADPLLLVMGGVVGEGRYSFVVALLMVVSAALLGDSVWFELGRRRGRSVVKFLCRWTLEPEGCVRRAQERFTTRGVGALLFAKFIPGMSLVSIPLAGLIGMPRWRFLLWDGLGSALWGIAYLSVGWLFHEQIQRVIDFLSRLGHGAVALIAALIAAYIGYRYYQRQRFVHSFKVGKITPEALFDEMQSDVSPIVVDLRHESDIAIENLKISGARILKPTELRSRSHEIPLSQEIILYCS